MNEKTKQKQQLTDDLTVRCFAERETDTYVCACVQSASSVDCRLVRAFENWIAFIVSDYLLWGKSEEKNVSAICHQYHGSDKRNVSHGAASVHPLRVFICHMPAECWQQCSSQHKPQPASRYATTLKLLHEFVICIKRRATRAPIWISEFRTKFIYDRLVSSRLVSCINTSSHASLKLLYYAQGNYSIDPIIMFIIWKNKGTLEHTHARQPTNRPHKLLSATSNACRNGEMGFISRIIARPCGFTRSPLIEVCYVYDMHDGCYSWFHGSWYKWLYSVCCRFELRIRLNALTYDLKWREARHDTSTERTNDKKKSEKQIYSYFAFIIILSFREPNEIRVDDIWAYGVCCVCVCERAYYMSYDDFHWIIFMIPLCKYLSDEPMCASERANDRTKTKRRNEMCRVEVNLLSYCFKSLGRQL